MIDGSKRPSRTSSNLSLELEWSLLPLIPAAMDMANPVPGHQEKKSMCQLMVYADDFTVQAHFEEQLAHKTVAAFRKRREHRIG
jgi:hypothetical protein